MTYRTDYPASKLASISEQVAQIVQSLDASERQPLVDWAQTILLPDGSGGARQLDLTLTPFWREPLSLVEDRSTRSITIVSSQRNGKTAVLLTAPILSSAARQARDVVCLLPSQESVSRYSDGDLDRVLMLNGLGSAVGAAAKSRKRWANGSLTYLVWPTEQSLRGVTASLSIASELDSYPPSPDKATWLALLKKRTQTTGSRSKLIVEGSPSMEWVYDEGAGIEAAIEALGPNEFLPTATESMASVYNQTDRAKWTWTCPHCDGDFVADWSCIHIPEHGPNVERAAQAAVVCPHCGAVGLNRFDLNQTGKWVSALPKGPHRGFHVSGVASPFVSIQELATNFLNGMDEIRKTGSDITLRGFFNSDLGQQFIVPKEFRVGITDVPISGEHQAWRCPPDAFSVVAVVDQQKAWYCCCYYALADSGAIHWLGREDVTQLEGENVSPFDGGRHASRLFTHCMSKSFPVAGCDDVVDVDCVVIDIGGGRGNDEDSTATSAAYGLWKEVQTTTRAQHRSVPVYLMQGERRRRFKPGMVVTYAKEASERSRVWLNQLDTTALADMVMSGLERETQEPGAFVVHSGIDKDHIKELTAEVKGVDGFYRPRTRHIRRESWDCARMVFGYVALRQQILRADSTWPGPAAIEWAEEE